MFVYNPHTKNHTQKLNKTLMSLTLLSFDTTHDYIPKVLGVMKKKVTKEISMLQL